MKDIWFCKIGESFPGPLPHGADAPMRTAVRDAYLKLTGMQPNFIFSGWGQELEEIERAVVENRPPVCKHEIENLIGGPACRLCGWTP